jgi:hypothetical protein
MKRAQLYLWSVLHSVEHVNERVLSDLAGEAAGTLPIADPELRKADMKAAVGAWADRDDLPDSGIYISNLRNELREHWPIPA